MAEKIIIASDSTTDLSAELIEKNNVIILPLGITVDNKEYTDGVDINPDIIYENYEKTGKLPKTAAINIAQFESFFAEHTANGESLVFLTISSQMSSTYSNACIAAEDFENVYVVDTQNLSTGGGLMLLTACELRDAGKSAAEIAEGCREVADRIDASFVIDSLEFLYKGGRCSALAALGANLLQLKPCIMVRGGKMGVGKKYRGKFADVLPKYIADHIGDASDIYQDKIFVTHAGCDMAIVEACVNKVKEIAPFENVYVTRAGCTVSSHCGRNTLGVLFIRKEDLKLD